MESASIARPCKTCIHSRGVKTLNDAPHFCWDCLRTPSKKHWEEEEEEKLTPLVYAALHYGTDDNTVFVDEDDNYSPLLAQIGGNHYSKLKIQPMEYSMANKLDACQHTAIKYITRFRDKGTPMVDLDKAIHCIQMLKEFEQNEQRQYE